MAEHKINLNNYKASGVYTVLVDESENISLPLTTGRLIIGSSRVGPFNTIVLIKDPQTLRAIFGENDKKLEKKGSFFHRSIEIALREGPVFALNVVPLDTSNSENLDNTEFATFNTDLASFNNEGVTPTPIINLFNKRRLWFASDEYLNRTKNIELGDNFPINPGAYGQVNGASNKVITFSNTGSNNITIWVKKANVAGYDVTFNEWYSSISTDTENIPNYVNGDDLVSDYMVEVMIVKGNWTNYISLSKDPIYSKYFNASGLKSTELTNFVNRREIKVINQTIGAIIPDFVDQSKSSISIDTLVNASYSSTGILCAIDADKLDMVDLENSTFMDQDMETHRIDILGHGFNESISKADDGGFDTDLTTGVDPVNMINVISYIKPGKDSLIYQIDNIILESEIPTELTAGMNYIVNPATGNSYIISTINSKIYELYKNGFINNVDSIVDSVNTNYISITDNLDVIVTGGINIKYIKIEIYSDKSLINMEDVNSYIAAGNDYIKLVKGESTFSNIFDLNDVSYFTSFSLTNPNELVLNINTTDSDKLAKINDFIQVGNLITSKVIGDSRPISLRIESITSAEELSPYQLIYTIKVRAPRSEAIYGIDTTDNKLTVTKTVAGYVDSLKGKHIKGFKIREMLLPNSTAERLSDIMGYLFEYTSIPEAIASKELIDFRYVVDTYEGEISPSSKYYITKIAADHGQSMAFVNTPSAKQFEQSQSPSFIDPSNLLLSTDLISQGGNVSLNPQFLFKFAEDDINGIPLSSFMMPSFPNFIVKQGNRDISVPPAAYISNLYVKKFKNGQPFLIVAGSKRGVISDPEVAGLEFELTDKDRAYLEPIGHNLIVKRKGYGTLLYSNNTAYQRINSALNNAHVRDNLSTIERDINKILFNFLFDFNDEITRIRIRTLVENYLDSVVNAKGLSSYSVTFDKSNNNDTVLENNAAIIDIKVDFPRGIHKFINKITITRVGGQLSSQSTGFTASF